MPTGIRGLVPQVTPRYLVITASRPGALCQTASSATATPARCVYQLACHRRRLQRQEAFTEFTSRVVWHAADGLPGNQYCRTLADIQVSGDLWAGKLA